MAENTVRLIEDNAIPLSSEKRQIDLALVTMEQLGFDSITRMSIVLKRAKSMGLDIVPAEVPLQLLLQLGSKEEVLKELKPIGTINFAMDLLRQGNQKYLLGIMHISESKPCSTLCAWSRNTDSELGCYESIVFKV